VDLRAFKQRQLRRRQTYLEQTISAMSADSLANSDSYTPDDRKDFTETLEYLRNDLAEVRAFISGGCSSAPFAKPASVKSAVSDASLTRSASPSSVLQHTETASVSASQSTHAVATPEGSATDLRTLLENPVPKVFVAEAKPQPSPSSPRSNGAPGQDQGSTGSGSDVKQLQQQVQDIHDALLKQDQDFALVLGLGSLVINRHASDYKNDANVIHTTNLGSATPQLLTGVDFRSHVPSLTRRFRKLPLCGTPVSDLPGAPLQKPAANLGKFDLGVVL